MTKDNNLPSIRKENNSISEFKRAESLLTISSQLALNSERLRWVKLLKEIDFEEATIFIENKNFIPEELLEPYKEYWDWNRLSFSWDKFPWSIEFIERFEEKWNWDYISRNTAIPWSIELIERFKNQWDWTGLSLHPNIPWSVELIEHFKNQWNWGDLSRNQGIPWSTELIERFKNQWNWSYLGKHIDSLQLLPDDIIKIMEHHLKNKNKSLEYPLWQDDFGLPF